MRLLTFKVVLVAKDNADIDATIDTFAEALETCTVSVGLEPLAMDLMDVEDVRE